MQDPHLRSDFKVDNLPTSGGHSLTRIRTRPDSVCILIRVILDPCLRVLYPSRRHTCIELLSIEHVCSLNGRPYLSNIKILEHLLTQTVKIAAISQGWHTGFRVFAFRGGNQLVATKSHDVSGE